MTTKLTGLDCIYVAAAAHDARYTRICIASIRYFYPDVAIRILPGGTLDSDLCGELTRYWDVDVAPIKPGNWGWGFVKLEPLFGREGERFLVLDSDTAVIGDVLATPAASSADFLVDDEQQNDADTRRLYYDWQQVTAIDAQAQPPEFVFNSGQWLGTAGVLRREDFEPLIDWGAMPPRVNRPDLFKQGEQGVFNYVVNRAVQNGKLTVERRKIMLWPGHGMSGIDRRQVAERRAPPLVVHWAGLKKSKLSDMIGGDLLMFFEELYYKRLPRPRLQRLNGIVRHTSRELRIRMRIRSQIIKRGIPFMR